MVKQSGLILAVLLGACSTTAYDDEVKSLASAALALADAPPSSARLERESAGVLDPTLDLLLEGGPIKYSLECGRQAKAAQEALVAAIPKGPEAEDAAFASFKTLKACSAVSLAPEKPIPAEKAKVDKQAQGPGGGADKSAEEKKREQAEARLQAAQAARVGGAGVLVRSDILPKPVCEGSCSLDDYLGQIQAYGENLTAIADGKNVEAVNKGLDGAGKALGGLATAAKVSPVGTAIIDANTAITKMAIQQAQFNAMRAAVLDFDAIWPKVAPAVKTAARLRYAELAVTRAFASEQAALVAQQYLNDELYYDSPTGRLSLYQFLNARVTAAATAFDSARAADPSSAVTGLTKASHELALAMTDPSKQKDSVMAALKALDEQITALKKAAATPAEKPAEKAKD